jgi:hypothetical protein
MHGARAGGVQLREAGREDDEVPAAIARRGRNDHASRTELASPLGEVMSPGAGPGQLVERDPEILGHSRPTQVEDRQRAHVDAPQPAALGGRIDCAARRGRPLGPDRLRLERRIQRPRLTGSVVATLRARRTIGWEGGRIDPGLAVDATAEEGDRVQT